MKFIKIILLVAGSILAILILAAGVYVYHNLNYYTKPLCAEPCAPALSRKQVTLEDGTILNYAEGP